MNHRYRLYFLLSGFLLSAMSWAVAQEKPQPEKRWVRWRLIEVAGKSLADSILTQLQQGVSFQKLARRHSLHASAKEGGEIGWTALDSVDNDFKTAMASLPVGATSAILQKGNHFFILYKMNELPESGYLQWKEQKPKADSLLDKIESLINTGNSQAAMTLIKEAEERVKQIDDEDAYLRMLNFRGTALMRLSQFRDAATLFDSMLKISRNIRDPYGESVALGKLGNVYLSLGQYQQAIAYFDSALRIARELGDQRGEGDGLGDLGNVYHLLGQFSQAKAHYDSALVIVRKVGDRKSEGGWLGSLGNVCFSLGQYQQALAYYDRALSIAREIGVREVEGLWLGSLGNACFSLGQYQRAIAYFDSALVIARTIGNRMNEGALLGSLGVIAHQALSQYQRAIAYYDSALVIAREIGDRASEGGKLGNLGAAYKSLGQYQRAIAYHDSALVIAREIGDRAGEGWQLDNHGNAYNLLGQYQRAIAYHDSALVIAREIGDRAAEGGELANLGVAYDYLGQYQRAVAYHDSALVIAREIGDRAAEGDELGNLGLVYESLGQYQRAIAYIDSALSIAREIGDREGKATGLNNLGIAYSSLGQYHQAITYYDSALVIARAIDYRELEEEALGNLGDAYFSLDQYNRAIAFADSALFIAKGIARVEGIWRWYGNLAKSHSKISKTQSHQVIAFYDSAVIALESISEQLVEDPHKQSFLEDKQGLYRDFINYLLLQGKPSEQQRALEISEQARSRAFMELIARRFHGSEVEQKRELLAPANFQQIQATAQRLNASILEYFVSDSSLVIWLMKPEGPLHTATVPIKPAHFDSLLDICYLGFHQIEEKERAIPNPSFLATRNVRPVTGSMRSFDFTPSMAELYQILFPKEIRTRLPQEAGAKVVLVPHRKLSVIPIMALKDSTGHYLLEKYSCHQVPGIGVLLRTNEILEKRQKPGKIRGDEILLFGNPTMPNWGREVLPTLNGSENEVKAIAGKFQAGYQIGAEASEHAFKSNGRKKRLLHLATHGISFDASPLESFVALAPGNGEDGQLTAAEILEMQFAADLVVLSACETGLGKISGDGVEGLARSFMASGVPSLVVSLWNVDDEATKELMLAFYGNLEKGMDKAESLRQAQLKIMRTPKWRHPKYWAAFVLYGER